MSLVLFAVACGDDGQGGVTELSGESGSSSSSGSGSGSASASSSGSASSSASASAPAVEGDAAATAGDGGYAYASDVDSHVLVVRDICGIGELLDAGDFGAVAAIYADGVNSVKSDGSIRSIGGFAARDDRMHGLDAYYGTATPLDDFVTSALDGTGPFAGQSDAVRAQGVEKGMQNQVMVAWVVHELRTAMAKAADGNFDIQEDAVHNWDEGWAFYHGTAPGCAPYATGDKRAANFGTLADDGETAVANENILHAMIRGRDALIDGDVEAAELAAADVLKNVVVIYSQATIRYASLIEGDLADGDDGKAKEHQAEGLAFFRVIEALVAAEGADVDAINAILDLASEPGANGFGDEVRDALQPAWEALGIDAADIGELQ